MIIFYVKSIKVNETRFILFSLCGKVRGSKNIVII